MSYDQIFIYFNPLIVLTRYGPGLRSTFYAFLAKSHCSSSRCPHPCFVGVVQRVRAAPLLLPLAVTYGKMPSAVTQCLPLQASVLPFVNTQPIFLALLVPFTLAPSISCGGVRPAPPLLPLTLPHGLLPSAATNSSSTSLCPVVCCRPTGPPKCIGAGCRKAPSVVPGGGGVSRLSVVAACMALWPAGVLAIFHRH